MRITITSARGIKTVLDDPETRGEVTPLRQAVQLLDTFEEVYEQETSEGEYSGELLERICALPLTIEVER